MPRRLQPCGTYAAYRRHRRHGEDPDPACRDANAARSRRRTGAQPRGPLKPCGTVAAYQRHIAHREVPCTQCLDGAATRQRARRQARDARALLAAAPLDEAALHRRVLEDALRRPRKAAA